MADWKHVQELFLAAVDLSPAEQSCLLDATCTDPDLRAEVEEMLEADTEDPETFSRAVEDEAALWIDSPALPGERVGSYRVVAEIGSGGMGAVYLATRDDDQFHKRVAIKIVKLGMDTAEVLRRFRHEQQILAHLDHPYIARLLDGGTTSTGRPYFVMDYVEGQPIDAYCRDHNLDLESRCRLFLRIADAVSYAHRNLVLHLDLKPANILVASDGKPKLLDFGVAKILDAEALGALTALSRPVTPDHAAPEQIRGGKLTTATDVYGMGGLLVQLVAGRPPYKFHKATWHQIDQSVCETEPPRLSTLIHLPRQFRADLDAIAAKALRKEPQERYTSVQEFAADLERCLDRLPVLARNGDWAYSAKKLLRRRWRIISATAAVGALLLGATLAAVRQARIADTERQRAEQNRATSESNRIEAQQETWKAQRSNEVAEQQRARAEVALRAEKIQRSLAEHRFGEVHSLARSFMIDTADALFRSGAPVTERKAVVELGLRYYDSLLKEAQGNPSLLQEIADGYSRLASVQGNPSSSNLGDTAGAIQSYRKAMAIRDALPSSTAEATVARMQSRIVIAAVLMAVGQTAEAKRLLQETIRIGQPVRKSEQAERTLAEVYGKLGEVSMQAVDSSAAIAYFSDSLERFTTLEQAHPRSVQDADSVAVAHYRLAQALVWARKVEEGLEHYRAALRLDRNLLKPDPTNKSVLTKVRNDYYGITTVFAWDATLARPGEYREAVEASADMAAREVESDPKDVRALHSLMAAQIAFGDYFDDSHDITSAIVQYRKAVQNGEKYLAAADPTFLATDALIAAYHRLARELAYSGEIEGAFGAIDKAEEYVAKAEKMSPGSYRMALRTAYLITARAIAFKTNQKWSEAIEAYRTAIHAFEEAGVRDPANEAPAAAIALRLDELANCYQVAGDHDSMLRTSRRAIDMFDQIGKTRKLTPEEAQARTRNTARLGNDR